MKNYVQLIGHVGKELESIKFANDKKVVKFSLATNTYYTTASGEKKEETQWHNIVAFGKLGELMENFLTKGSLVCVWGKLSHRQYEDKNGIKRYYTEIISTDFLDAGKRVAVA